jgi:transcriptional regulator with XRE-family HTH domain
MRPPVSLRAMAEATGIHRGTLSRIETGRMLPTDEELRRIEQAYGVPRDAIYATTESLTIAHDR